MNNASDTTTLRDYVGVLSTRRNVVIACVVIASLIGLGYSLVRSPTYTSTASVEFRDETKEIGVFTPGIQVFPEVRPDQAAAAASKTVTTDQVVDRVQRALPTEMSTSELRESVEATVQPDSNLVAIEASADEAGLSAQIANEFAEQTKIAAREQQREKYRNQANELKSALNSGLDPATEASYRNAIARLRTLSRVADPVEITQPAEVPGSPSSPKPFRDTLLAAILGLLIGIAVAFIRNALDRRITDSHQAQHDLGLPLVGYVRADALGLTGIGRNGDSFVSEDDLEAFRILRTNVDFLAGDRGVSSLVVTSALPEEGKSTVAAWFAYVSAVAGRRTLLVECDFRRPVLANRFGVDTTPGLADYIAGDSGPKEVLRSVPVRGREAVDVLPLIPAGENVFQPTEAIGSKKFQAFVDQITRAYDLVIFDSAPLLPVSDTLELIPQVDGVLFCVRLDQTTRDQALAAKQAMQHLPDRPTGLVITGVRPGSDDDYYGYYSYASTHGTVARG
jgi:capsular exopolysaccharide synthesis family protein